LYRKYSGRIDWRELEKSVIEGHANFRMDSVRFVINDFLDCESVEFNAESIEELAARSSINEKINPRYSVAFVVTNPDVKSVVDAYLAIGLTKAPTRYFSTVEEALAWQQYPPISIGNASYLMTTAVPE
jgi:hypothetical protein